MKMVVATMPKRQNPPTEQEKMSARDSMQTLSRYAREDQPLRLCIVDAGHEERIELPYAAVALLMVILKAMTAGLGMTLIPEHAELNNCASGWNSECIPPLSHQTA